MLIELSVGGTIKVDRAGTLRRLSWWQLKCDGLMNGIVGNANQLAQGSGPLQPIELFLVADFLFIIVGSDQVDVLGGGKEDETDQSRKEENEKDRDNDGPGIA